MLKHTPVEHEDRERLQRAQRHIHCLAVAINQHKDGSEQMEQRLREIEAIVDGLDDVSFCSLSGKISHIFSW